MEPLDRITVNPNVCLGQPTIRGMRITVSVVLNWTFDNYNSTQPELSCSGYVNN